MKISEEPEEKKEEENKNQGFFGGGGLFGIFNNNPFAQKNQNDGTGPVNIPFG